MIVKSKVQTGKNYSQTMKLRSNTHGCELNNGINLFANNFCNDFPNNQPSPT